MMAKEQIKISAAIEKRKKEIEQLKKLKPKIQQLIDDSKAAEEGDTCMSRSDWEKLKKEVEDAMWELELCTYHRGFLPAFSGTVGLPTHWSWAEIV